MFGFGLRPFEEDPFFRDHNERMRGMFNTFHQGFGHHPLAVQGPPNEQERLRDGRNREHRGQDRNLVAPFDMFGGGMFGMPPMFHNMGEQFATAANNPNTFSYSQSSVMSYSNDGSGEPKYFQAHHSTKNAPGGIKETKSGVKDSETGVQRMAVGHHIGDRGHVVERSLNRRTGEEERKQDFLNIDEEHADEFQHEWTRRTKSSAANHVDSRHRNRHRALPDSRHGRHDRPRERPAEHDRERRIRQQNRPPRPSNRHAPKEGMN